VSSWSSYLFVALGGALGAVTRFAVGAWMSRRIPTAHFPYGTLLINLTGCLAIALFLSAAATRSSLNEAWRYLFPIGFVGAYTTFSTYEWELLQLAGTQRWGLAALYFTISNAAGFLCVALGSAIGRRL
jgi:CrcB protein